MQQSTTSPPVRHGKAGLRLVINGEAYVLTRKKKGRAPAEWRLNGPRGAYWVYRANGYVQCTCPDNFNRAAHCKHIRAMQAVGLVPRGVKVGPAFSGHFPEELHMLEGAARAGEGGAA